MKRLYILKVGTTFPKVKEHLGDFDRWTLEKLGDMPIEVRVVDVENGATLPQASSCVGVVITGSHYMVTDAPAWSLRVERCLPALLAAGTPVLGICYGHQLLARATGGIVADHPKGPEIGTVDVHLRPDAAGDPLLDSLPRSFLGHATHWQSVRKLPPQAILLAGNDYEPHLAFRIGQSAWGVQFHPEFNARIMRGYIAEQTAQLEARGVDIDRLYRTVAETPQAAQTLAKFARYVVDQMASGDTE